MLAFEARDGASMHINAFVPNLFRPIWITFFRNINRSLGRAQKGYVVLSYRGYGYSTASKRRACKTIPRPHYWIGDYAGLCQTWARRL